MKQRILCSEVPTNKVGEKTTVSVTSAVNTFKHVCNKRGQGKETDIGIFSLHKEHLP